MSDVVRAHAALIQDNTIQFDFPAFVPASQPTSIFPEISMPTGGGTLLWVVLCLTLIGIIVVFVQNRRGTLPTGLLQDPVLSLKLPAKRSPDIDAIGCDMLSQADALAAGGDYGKAVHALLLRSIETIQQRFPNAVRPSHTSRDIGRLSVLPETTQQAFACLAEPTERAMFARRTLTRREWDQARSLCERLLPPEKRL